MTCDAATLTELSACFDGFGPNQQAAAQIYLLAVAAGIEPDPATIIEDSKCFEGMSPPQSSAAQNYLLCQIANA